MNIDGTFHEFPSRPKKGMTFTHTIRWLEGDEKAWKKSGKTILGYLKDKFSTL